MNMNQLVNMFTKLVARRAMNWGINKGMKTLSRKGGQQAGPQQDVQAGDLKKRMRNVNRMTRR